MKRLRLWFAATLVVLVASGGLWVWWELGANRRPLTITKSQSQIVGLLDASGWVSALPQPPGGRLTDRASLLYLVSYRDCPGCIAFEKQEFAKLRAANVMTRVIVIAQPDLNGRPQSTPAERATVAELWVNRSWSLYDRWVGTPVGDWTASGVPPADGDAARTAVIDSGRSMGAQLTPLLKANGLASGYPILIWWDSKGAMRGCVCGPHSFDSVARELGA